MSIQKILKSNVFISCSIVFCCLLLFWFYGCESKVRSLYEPDQYITRGELQAELDMFLQRAEAKFRQLDQMDQLKQTLLNHLTVYSETGTINPLGVVMSIIGVLGGGAVADNVRQRIKTSKTNSTNSPT